MTDRDEQMLTYGDVSKLLQVSRKTIERMVAEDADFPKPIRVRGQERFTLGDIRKWQEYEKLKAKAAAAVATAPDRIGQSQTSKKQT